MQIVCRRAISRCSYCYLLCFWIYNEIRTKENGFQRIDKQFCARHFNCLCMWGKMCVSVCVWVNIQFALKENGRNIPIWSAQANCFPCILIVQSLVLFHSCLRLRLPRPSVKYLSIACHENMSAFCGIELDRFHDIQCFVFARLIDIDI